MKLPHTRREREREGGQIIVLFALSLVVILAFGGLLFNGRPGAGAPSPASECRRCRGAGRRQPAGRPERMQRGRQRRERRGRTLVTAAKAAVQTNIPGYTASNVVVTCPTGYGNNAVAVDLRRNGTGLLRGRDA